MKKYNSNWLAKEMEVDFNQKQYRQDLAAYVSKSKFWYPTRVTRSRTVQQGNNSSECIKEFLIYNGVGGEIVIRYTNKNEIIYTTNEKILEEYLNLKHTKIVKRYERG